MIDVLLSNSKSVGSCVACHRYSTPTGMENHPVVEITMSPEGSNNSITIRLCALCLDELKYALRELRVVRT